MVTHNISLARELTIPFGNLNYKIKKQYEFVSVRFGPSSSFTKPHTNYRTSQDTYEHELFDSNGRSRN